MSKVQGLYTLHAHINGGTYTFTGADRFASFGITGAEQSLNLICFGAPSLAGSVKLPVENEIKIKAVRLIAQGAPGLQNAPGQLAGKFRLDCVGDDGNGTLYQYDDIFLHIPNWGEWFDTNISLRPYKRTGGNHEYTMLDLAVNPDNALFQLDDFNIQDDFIGQGTSAEIELLIDTAGIWDTANHVLF